MTDLEQRLRDLGASLDPGEATSVADLRTRARRRRTRRRIGASGVLLVVVVLMAAVVRVGGEDTGEEVVAGPPTSAPPVTTPGQRSIGDVQGVSVEVTPATDLVDGQEVTVRIDGLEELPGAQLVMCRGDVEQATASTLCDVGVIGLGMGVPAATNQVVQVSRFLVLLNGSEVDCATEPAGCVLGVGSTSATPLRGVTVPLRFAPAPLPAPPVIEVSPVDGLSDGATVTVAATNLRPNRSYTLLQCTADRRICSELDVGRHVLQTDSGGSGRAELPVATAIYGSQGRADCTAESCIVGPSLEVFEFSGDTTITFAPGTRAPIPTLKIEPSGPYDDGQEVTVSGTGFPAGLDVARWIGVCPAHLDTAREERCGYPSVFSSVVVGQDGTFTMATVLRAGTAAGRCSDLPSGCVLAWVLNHGPIAASTPVRFR